MTAKPWTPTPVGVLSPPPPTGKHIYLCQHCSKPFMHKPVLRFHEAGHPPREP